MPRIMDANWAQMLRMRRKAVSTNTERTINKIIRLVVETGTLTGM